MSIAELNNQAISLLVSQGSKPDTIKVLKQAVETLRSAPPPVQNPTAEVSFFGHGRRLGKCRMLYSPFRRFVSFFPNSRPFQIHQHNRQGDPQSVHSVDVKTQTQSSVENDIPYQFLYQRAFLVSEDERSVNLKAAVVFYNLAFLNHMRGHEEPTTSSKKFAGATSLYVLALDMVKRHSREYGSKRALRLCLAIANNLGDLYWQQYCDLDEARKCFSLVREILKQAEGHFMTQTGPSVEANFDEDEYSLFLLNAMIRATGEVSVATAA